MPDIKTNLANKAVLLLSERGLNLTFEQAYELFEKPSDSAMGDFALPCFKLSKLLHKAPPAIASELCECCNGIEGIASVTAVGGYLNFKLDYSVFSQQLDEILNTSDYGADKSEAGKTVCIDFSSPNIAKRFHLGHLGTTVIGNSLRNIFKFCGWNTVAINYLGDWGTQFGKLIVAYKKWSSYEEVSNGGINELSKLYVRFCDAEKADESLSDEARAAFTELEHGNPEYLQIWQSFKEISLREYKKTYDLLGIDFDSYNGEAFYSDKIAPVVDELREKGLLVVDDGASMVRLDEYNMPPAMILKRDGSTLYPARDIAAAIWRKKEYNFDKCLYVTSAGQSLHFAQWFKVVELMGRDWADGLVHVPYGTMSVGGEKLASRTGNVVLLDDLLSEAIAKCENIIAEKNASLENRRQTAEAVGTGAVVFNALSSNRIKDSDFVWEDALSFDGNTGPYLQYTYARCSGVLEKCVDKGKKEDYVPKDCERDTVTKLSEFPEAVIRAKNEYEPSIISRYLISLCATFNNFYNTCSVMRAEEGREFRIRLVSAVLQVLGSGLLLLGMKKTEKI